LATANRITNKIYTYDLAKGYEEQLKAYDANKNAVSDWDEYLTGLQLQTQSQATNINTSAQANIADAYSAYLAQRQYYGGLNISEGLKQSMGQQALSSFSTSRQAIETKQSEALQSLWSNYASTVSSAQEAYTTQGTELAELTEQLLEYAQSSEGGLRTDESGNPVYSDFAKLYGAVSYADPNKYKYESFFDTDAEGKTTLNRLGQSAISVALNDPGLAEYLQELDSSSGTGLWELAHNNMSFLQDLFVYEPEKRAEKETEDYTAKIKEFDAKISDELDKYYMANFFNRDYSKVSALKLERATYAAKTLGDSTYFDELISTQEKTIKSIEENIATLKQRSRSGGYFALTSGEKIKQARSELENARKKLEELQKQKGTALDEFR